MYDFLILAIIPIIMLVPLAYLVGYQLRSFVPQKRRHMVGFAVILVLMPISFILSLEFYAFSRLIQSVQIATSTGFPLGIAGPPFKDLKKRMCRSRIICSNIYKYEILSSGRPLSQLPRRMPRVYL